MVFLFRENLKKNFKEKALVTFHYTWWMTTSPNLVTTYQFSLLMSIMLWLLKTFSFTLQDILVEMINLWSVLSPMASITWWNERSRVLYWSTPGVYIPSLHGWMVSASKGQPRAWVKKLPIPLETSNYIVWH